MQDTVWSKVRPLLVRFGVTSPGCNSRPIVYRGCPLLRFSSSDNIQTDTGHYICCCLAVIVAESWQTRASGDPLRIISPDFYLNNKHRYKNIIHRLNLVALSIKCNYAKENNYILLIRSNNNLELSLSNDWIRMTRYIFLHIMLTANEKFRNIN